MTNVVCNKNQRNRYNAQCVIDTMQLKETELHHISPYFAPGIGVLSERNVAATTATAKIHTIISMILLNYAPPFSEYVSFMIHSITNAICVLPIEVCIDTKRYCYQYINNAFRNNHFRAPYVY